jgi:hypothetical protein
MMKSGRYDLFTLVTHEFGIEDIAEALVMGGIGDQAQKVCITL